MVAVVAAVSLLESEGEDTTVAAVCPGASSGQHGGRQRGGSWRGKKKPGHGGSVQQVSHTVLHTAGQVGDWTVFQPFLLWSQGHQDMPGSLHLVGKLGGWGQLNAVAAGQLIHMLDQISNRHFLVDTSASYSILPHRSSLPAMGPTLLRQAGQLIPC